MKKEEPNVFELMGRNADFLVNSCGSSIDLRDRNRFTPLQLNSAQRIQISALFQEVPKAMTAVAMANAYTVSFPKGLPTTLMKLHQGGVGSPILESGKIVGSASFNPMAAQAIALSAFTAMSAVTGQYFLAQINSELAIVNNKLDDIMEFLYGEKKAELMAEISFIRYAHANYNTIMMHEQQRIATISNLQEARKIAMKDIEFYLNDLDNLTIKEAKDYATLCDFTIRALKTKDSIEMSRQLYVVSGLLELYYAQNYDENYIFFIRNDMISYINKCDRKINSGLSAFKGKLSGYRPKSLPILAEKVENREKLLEEIDTALMTYQDGNDSSIRIALHETLNALNQKVEYFIDDSGCIYVKK